MPIRIDEILYDPRNESVPNLGEAAQLLAALPEEIRTPKHVGLKRWDGRPPRCLRVALTQLLSQDNLFVRRQLNDALVLNIALFIAH